MPPNKMAIPLTLHYARLGLHPGATRAQLSAAYRAAALKHHPDRGGDAGSFAAIRESYEAILQSHIACYAPASMRSHGTHRTEDWSGMWGIAGSILMPTALGLAVGIRLMYTGSERNGLRAGGTSRVIIREDGTVEGFESVLMRDRCQRMTEQKEAKRAQ